MPNTVYQNNPFDPSIAAQFNNGEKALSPTANGQVHGVIRTYYLARRGVLQAGHHTIKIYSDSAVGVWIGNARNSRRMLLSTRAALGVQVFDFDVFEGEDRIDLYLQNLNAFTSYCWVAFSIYRNGTLIYASNAASWQWDDSPISDGALLGSMDSRLAYPVWSILPNWEDGILESLEWKTDILKGERSTEQRRSLRSMPRRTMEAGFLRSRANRSRLDSIFAGQGTRKFLVPLWFEQYKLPASLSPAAPSVTFPAGTLAKREFRAGDRVFINDKNPDVFDVAIIATANVATDTITWEVPPTRTWPAGARIIPLRLAQLLDAPSLSNRSDAVGISQVRFALVDPDVGFDPSWGYCSPLFTYRPDWSESIDVDYQRDIFTLDNGINTPYILDPSDVSHIGKRIKLMLRGRTQVNNFRRFMAMSRGKAVRFYMPSFTNDVLPKQDLNGISFEAQPIGFWESMQTRQSGRYMLGFFFNDGSPAIFREVASVEPVGLQGPPYRMTGELFNLKEPLPVISLRRIARISWVEVVRFNQDTFELQHEVDNSGVVLVDLVTTTVDAAGMPPIDCWVTSRPYPLESVDDMDITATIVAGEMYEGSIKLTESIDMTSTIESGSYVEVVYRGYSMTTEDIELSAMITEGSVEVVLPPGFVETAMLPESLDLTTSIQSGEMNVVLLGYTMVPEAINISMNLTEGEFT